MKIKVTMRILMKMKSERDLNEINKKFYVLNIQNLNLWREAGDLIGLKNKLIKD